MTLHEQLQEDSIKILSRHFPTTVSIVLLKKWEEGQLNRTVHNQVTEILDELKGYWALVRADKE